MLSYDVLMQRALLDLGGTRQDPLTRKLVSNGLPGVEFLDDLSNVNRMFYNLIVYPFFKIANLTGHSPDFMRIDGNPEGFGSIYNYRIGQVDVIAERLCKGGLIDQALTIGSGWDLRSLALSKSYHSVSFIELDRPEQIEKKAMGCKTAGIKLDPITSIASTLDSAVAVRELRDRIDMSKRTLIVMEGVSMYLDPSVMAEILFILRDLPKGSELVGDFVVWADSTSPDSLCCIRSCGSCVGRCCGKAFSTNVLNLLGEPLKFTLSATTKSCTETLAAYVDHTTGNTLKLADPQEVFIGVFTRIVHNV